MRKEYYERFDIVEATAMAKRGCSQLAIGRHFNIPHQRVSDLFKEYGVYFEKRLFPINDEFFDEIDCEEKAYLLGYLVADGCICVTPRKSGNNTYRISFKNSIDDKEAIDLMHKCICPDATIVLSKNLWNRRKKPQYTLQWRSRHMAKTLMEKYHIKPRKTYDKEFKIPEGAIPDDMWRHFIRGFFDGDGHVGHMTIEFVFTSKPFMDQVMAWFKNFKYKCVHVQGKTTDYWKVVLCGNDRNRACISKFFYKDAHYYLTRKYEAFYIEIDYRLSNRVIEIVEHRAE